MKGNVLTNKKIRTSNVELLRIVSMLLIISFHYVYKSEYVFPFDTLTVHDYFIKIFYFFGELGVNLFALISGYFLIKGKFSIKKLIKLILEVDFYYLIIIFIASAFNLDTTTAYTTIKDYFLMFFPTLLDKYWFITAYVLVYCFSPYLNRLVQNITQVEFKKLLLMLIVIFSIIPTFFGIFFNTSETLLYYNRFIWLIVMYLIGSYIRLYSIKFLNSKRNIYLTFCISLSIILLSVLFIFRFRYKFLFLGTTELAYLLTPNNFPMLFLSLSVFYIFLNLKVKNNQIINKLASTIFGIYLIHHSILHPFIWKVVFKTKEHLMGAHPILSIILSTLILFIVCALIDLLRQLLEKITIDKILDSKLIKRIGNLFMNLFVKIESLM